MTEATRYCPLPDPFPMRRGGVLHGARIAYETWGTLDDAADNAGNNIAISSPIIATTVSSSINVKLFRFICIECVLTHHLV